MVYREEHRQLSLNKPSRRLCVVPETSVNAQRQAVVTEVNVKCQI